ncbi:MAP kinase kinase Wis1 [Microbotryomycetes sp. JL201]|nr:MAP kinase kinase Wis1 [Microbotryomycetes sp. JL201]
MATVTNPTLPTSSSSSSVTDSTSLTPSPSSSLASTPDSPRTPTSSHHCFTSARSSAKMSANGEAQPVPAMQDRPQQPPQNENGGTERYQTALAAQVDSLSLEGDASERLSSRAVGTATTGASGALALDAAAPGLSSTTMPRSPQKNAGAPPPLYPRQSAPPVVAPRPTPAAASASGSRPSGAPTASGGLRAGVRGAPLGAGGIKLPPSLAAKMAAMTSTSRAGTPPSNTASASGSPNTGSPVPSPAPQPLRAPSAPGSVPGRMGAAGPAPPTMPRFGGPVAGRGGGMMARRRAGPGLTLSGMGINAEQTRREGEGAGVGKDGSQDRTVESPGERRDNAGGTPFSNFRRIVDPSGRLNFASKAVLHSDGVDFSSGASFKIKMDDFELFEELGKGNYGTVQKVWHKPTKVTMALKEIRLELDDAKLKTIITELDILHRAISPYIIDFYGAFFIESCVYYCMEFMDARSLDNMAGFEVPEDVLARVTRSVVLGLKFLKDELKIMHRDVKPTNILLNRKGQVKLCDFGVSGQLDRSLAKTNIGCQSYMAPERIKGESQGVASSYTASSDVWSLGLSIIEFAIGHYPYPPETYQNVFAQLTAIVHGDPPALPEKYSETARDFVSGCLEKIAARRPNYAQLLEHPFMKADETRQVDMVEWVSRGLEWQEKNPRVNVPALA